RHQSQDREGAQPPNSRQAFRARRRSDRMKRREFITLIGGAAAWPLAARAQQPAKLPTIGFLGQSTRSATSEWTAAFVQRLRELGWIDGRNVAIEYRWGKDVTSASSRSRPSSSGSRSMSSSRREPHKSSR